MQIKHFSYLVVMALLATCGVAAPAAANADGSLQASSSNLEKRPNFKIIYRGDIKEAEKAYPLTVPLLLALDRSEQNPKPVAVF
ncbi:hypothetical protein BDW67DRAFT_189504 [Aspergillus spinulosporus]